MQAEKGSNEWDQIYRPSLWRYMRDRRAAIDRQLRQRCPIQESVQNSQLVVASADSLAHLRWMPC